MSQDKILQFSYENGHGVHALVHVKASLPCYNVYYVNAIRSNPEVQRVDTWLCEISHMAHRTRVRGKTFYRVYYVNPTKLLIPGDEVIQREKELFKLKREWGKKYPLRYYMKEKEEEFVFGLITLRGLDLYIKGLVPR